MKILITSFIASLLVFSAISAQKSLQVKKSKGGDALEFIPNKGQIVNRSGKQRTDILYHCKAGHEEIFLREKGLSYVVNILPPNVKPKKDDKDGDKDDENDSYEYKYRPKNEQFKTCRIDMDFIGANNPTTQASQPAQGYINYYFPQCPEGITNIKPYHNILYTSIYPNIDISYKGTYTNGFKYDIIVNPGGDAENIKMKYTGTENVELIDGKLIFSTYTGKMEEHIPKIYQDINGEEVSVDGKYVLLHQGSDSADGTIVRIQVGDYNKAYPLIIDPWWGSYCGGSNMDISYSCALDNLGNTVVSGAAVSSNFPVTVGAFQTSLASSQNCFIIKFNTTGQRLWATYYGGDSTDAAYSVTTDANNNIAITGVTSSTNFPVSVGAFQTSLAGHQNAFVVKFNPNGTRLWGTYCGGNADDVSSAIIFDKTGNVAITGTTSSYNFPASVGAFQNSLTGSENAFVEKFDPNGNRIWGTFLGGSDFEEAYGVCADANGNIAVCGASGSSNFPVTSGAFQITQDEGFLSEFNSGGALLWSTYYGGTPIGCAVDKSNNIVIAGFAGDLVATPGAYQTSYTTGNGFAAKFNYKGNRLWATFSNQPSDETGTNAMAVDDGNNVYLQNEIDPISSDFDTSCGFQAYHLNQQEEYVVVKLDSNAHYACATYVGGTIYTSKTISQNYSSPNLCARNGRLAITAIDGGGFTTNSGSFQPNDPDTNTNFGFIFAPAVINLCSFACGDTNPPTLTVSHIITTIDTCLGYASFVVHAKASCDSGGGIYTWSFPGGNPSTFTGPYASHILYTNPGTYNVKLKYIACSVDSFMETVTIKSGFHDSLVTTPGNCHQKGKAIAFPSDGIAPYTYWWSNGSTNQSDTGLGVGTYTCVVSGKNGCTDTIVFQIQNPSSPPFITKPQGDTAFCLGGSVVLSASGGSNFVWSPSSSLSCTNCPSTIATPSVTTTYTVTGLDSLGCLYSAGITVTVDNVPLKPIFDTLSICQNGTVVLSINSGSAYLWNTGATTSSISVSPTTTTTYNSIVTSGGGCKDTVYKTVEINIPQLYVCCDTTIVLGNSAVLIAGDCSNYTWVPASGLNCDSCANVIANPTVTTTYTVTGYDINGCPVTKIVTVVVEGPCGDFFVPNVFTPNGDGLNNVFEIKILYVENYSIIIYDRWGKEMFTTTNSNLYWNGNTESGGQAPEGVYYYILKATCQGTTYKKDGFLQLIR